MSLSIGNMFDANFYRAANSDLSGLNDAQALSHFQAYGLNEGRSFSPLVDLNFYRSSNSDLKNLNNSQLLDHLENYGIAEDRNFSPVVDLDYYRIANSDLKSFNNEQKFNHLKNYGIKEGRNFSAYFDFNYYRANNKDLALANLNNNQLLQHFEIYGINEGRKSSPFFDAGYYKANNPDLASLKGIHLLEHFEYYGIFEGRQSANQYAGNTLNTAPQITLSSNYNLVLGHVGSSEPNDYYQFTLNQASTVNIYEYSYSKSISGQLIYRSGQPAINNKQINSDGSVVGNEYSRISLGAGTFYIHIQPQAENTNYALFLNAIPQGQTPVPNITDPLDIQAKTVVDLTKNLQRLV